MTAPMPGPDGPGVSNAGGSSLVLFKSSRTQGCGVEAGRVSVAPRGAGAFPRADRRLAAADERVGDASARQRSLCQGVRRATHARPRDAQGARMGADRRRDQDRRRTGRARRRSTPTRPPPRLDKRADEILAKRRWMLSRRALHEPRSRRLGIRRAGAGRARAVLLPAGGRGAGAQLHRFRHLCGRRHHRTCASSGSTIISSCCARRCSGRRSATPRGSSCSACRCRSRCRWPRRCCSTASSRGSRGFCAPPISRRSSPPWSRSR